MMRLDMLPDKQTADTEMIPAETNRAHTNVEAIIKEIIKGSSLNGNIYINFDLFEKTQLTREDLRHTVAVGSTFDGLSLYHLILISKDLTEKSKLSLPDVLQSLVLEDIQSKIESGKYKGRTALILAVEEMAKGHPGAF